MASLKFSFVFTLVLAVVFGFPQPNNGDSAVAFSTEASPVEVEGESVDSRYRPVYRPYGYGGQQYGSNYYSNQQYESHHASQQYGHSYGHQNYGHNSYAHQPYHGNDYYDRPYGYGYSGYPGYGGYYGRPQGILGTVGTVLDGLLGLREGEKKQTTDGVVASAVDEPPAVVITDSAPAAQIASSPDGDGVIFQ